MSNWRKVRFLARGALFAFAPGLKPPAQAQATYYDFLLKGGHVIDPANRRLPEELERELSLARVLERVRAGFLAPPCATGFRALSKFSKEEQLQ